VCFSQSLNCALFITIYQQLRIYEFLHFECRFTNHMKKRPISLMFIVFVMLFIYSLGLFRVIIPYANYKINYTYISKVLCKNKTKPDTHCNGKCYLDKQLKEISENEDEKQGAIETDIEIEIISLICHIFSFEKYITVYYR
jgi:hypothetical protein